MILVFVCTYIIKNYYYLTFTLCLSNNSDIHNQNGLVFWNNLTENIKNSSSLNIFKSKLKK